jgi:hypothetical protein
MSEQAVTIVSGVALLVVFALVGWNLRRGRAQGGQGGSGGAPHDLEDGPERSRAQP